MAKAPVEAKVYAALAGGGIGGALGGFLLWLLGVTVWHVPPSAAASAAASSAVPPPVADLLLILLPGGLAWLGSYAAPHTHRPDLPPLTSKPAIQVTSTNPGGLVTSGSSVIVGTDPPDPTTVTVGTA